MWFHGKTEPYTGPPTDFYKLNAVSGYLKHFDNLLFLTFMSNHGTTAEKMQAQKELIICERKLAWWEKHPNYDKVEVLRGVAAKKREWEMN